MRWIITAVRREGSVGTAQHRPSPTKSGSRPARATSHWPRRSPSDRLSRPPKRPAIACRRSSGGEVLGCWPRADRTLPQMAENSSEVGAMRVTDAFLRSFNAGDTVEHARTLAYPHVRLASGTVRIWESLE